MKLLLTLVLLIPSIVGYPQKKKDYSFSYEIQPDYDLERNIAEITTHQGQSSHNLYVVVENLKEEPFKFASVELSNQDTVIRILTNNNGEINAKLPEGKYTLSTAYIGYKRYTFPIQINNEHQLQCFFQLGRDRLKYYKIESKEALNSEALKSIENCIENNDDFETCNQENKYRISIAKNQ